MSRRGPRLTFDLLPCPRCGNAASIATPAQGMCVSWVCQFKGKKARTKQEAADLWNQLDRSEMPDHPTVPIYKQWED